MKTILITGTSSGLGREATKLFASNGWNVVATMRSPEKETELDQLEGVLVTRLDVLDQDSIASAIKAGIKRFGKIDALVNNAGYGQNGLFEGVSREQIRKQFETNVFGVMEVTRAIIPHFREHQGGTLINISSCGGIIGLPMISVYSSSKFAIEGFTESLSYELASQNITVKLVEPGGFYSNFTDAAEENKPTLALPESYGSFLEEMDRFFSSLSTNRGIDSTDVAKVVYEAATDGKDQLRYVIPGLVKPLVEAREKLGNQEFIEMMRKRVKQ
ncbi:SDR family oxidoreductase [Paenibacillus zanthoxyli]|uniref:SDR family oxidoreductase n=1 Tax=Paenibacillus zanthoxyli TaxID=369399 RepID=UPI00047143A5|nr:SDR family oxidoreductase [Paenibacillus zanthoxyli]